MERLPHEVLKYDILLRLPATTVVRFMLTCKTYYALVRSDQLFAEAHWQRGGPQGKKVIVFVSGRALSLNCDTLGITELRLPTTGGKGTKDVSVIGSCRGLVCLCLSSETFVAWNPTTGESRILPVTISLGSRSNWFYGFGYDCVGCDHKLVVIVNPVITKSNQDVEFNHSVVDYSLKSKSARYKSCSGMIGFEPIRHSAVYSNHHLYWEGKAFDPFCADPYMTRKNAVLTYDLQAEVVDYLSLPRINGLFQGIAATKDGDLCASFYTFGPDRFGVWVMKEHHVSSSWTLLCSFADRPHYPVWAGYRSLLGIRDDGSLILDNGQDVFIVEPVDGAPNPYILHKTGPENYDRSGYVDSRSWIYEESLLSPITEDASLNLIGYGRFTRHQAEEAGGCSSKLKKRKLDKHELRTKVYRNVLDGGTCPSGEVCEYKHDLTELERTYDGDGRLLNNKRIHE